MRAPQFVFWRESDRRYYLLAMALTAALAALVTLLYVVFHVSRIDGPSMEPTLMQEDRVLITRGYASAAVGDIVSFTAIDPNSGLVSMIKRVVAVEGDTIEVVGDNARVNGRPSSAAPQALVGSESYRLGPMVVPEGTVYVLGDNRPVSLDSRWIGFVPLTAIEGRAVAIILPLSRIGSVDD